MFIKPFIIQFNLDYISFLFLLTFSSSLFMLNLLAITYNEQNLLIIFLCIELIFLSVGLNFAFFSLLHIITLFILTIAATESSIGLSILINCYRLKHNITFAHLTDLRY
jgi:NADH-quinone oxidoreductase subunit K